MHERAAIKSTLTECARTRGGRWLRAVAACTRALCLCMLHISRLTHLSKKEAQLRARSRVGAKWQSAIISRALSALNHLIDCAAKTNYLPHGDFNLGRVSLNRIKYDVARVPAWRAFCFMADRPPRPSKNNRPAVACVQFWFTNKHLRVKISTNVLWKGNTKAIHAGFCTKWEF